MDQNSTPGSDPAPSSQPPVPLVPPATPPDVPPLEGAVPPPVTPLPSMPEGVYASTPPPPPMDAGIPIPPPTAATGATPPPPPPPEIPTVTSGTPLIPSTKDDRLWATLIHLGGLIGGWSAGLGFPGGNVLVPLIIWLIKREGSAFINDQGKEVLNFQITVTIIALGCFVLTFVCIGIPMLIALAIYSLVVGILGAIKANEGVAYRYPATIRLIT